MRSVVVGASSGLGRCIGVGLAQRGDQVALLARRVDKLDGAVADAGEGAVAVACDVTDEASVEQAITAAAEAMGGIDALVYAPAVGVLAPLTKTDAETWRRVFDTNVIGASVVTAAALPHLEASAGTAIYLSSVSASLTPPWPGLGSYGVSKAALDKLVEAWHAEHPEVGFTRLVVGDCAGGEGDAMTGFTTDWDPDLFGQMVEQWFGRQYMNGSLIDVDHLVQVVHGLTHNGASLAVRSLTVAPRPPVQQPAPQPAPAPTTEPGVPA